MRKTRFPESAITDPRTRHLDLHPSGSPIAFSTTPPPSPNQSPLPPVSTRSPPPPIPSAFAVTRCHIRASSSTRATSSASSRRPKNPTIDTVPSSTTHPPLPPPAAETAPSSPAESSSPFPGRAPATITCSATGGSPIDRSDAILLRHIPHIHVDPVRFQRIAGLTRGDRVVEASSAPPSHSPASLQHSGFGSGSRSIARKRIAPPHPPASASALPSRRATPRAPSRSDRPDCAANRSNSPSDISR